MECCFKVGCLLEEKRHDGSFDGETCLYRIMIKLDRL